MAVKMRLSEYQTVFLSHDFPLFLNTSYLTLCLFYYYNRNAYHTLFVARLSYDTTDKKLRREFEQFGNIKVVYYYNYGFLQCKIIFFGFEMNFQIDLVTRLSRL